ncbi:MAG: hypothetical protein E7559_07495 [Ruminococcaceae bacterium]|nr:hypothetical protein [Oscillospiraceae bacterium]
MKRIIAALAAALLILTVAVSFSGCGNSTAEDYQQPDPPRQEQSADRPAPFSREDIAPITEKYSVVSDYLAAVAPIETSWEYSEEDGSTYLTMISLEGWVKLKAFLPEDEVNSTTVPSPIVVDVTALSEAVLNTPCEIRELQWDSAEMEDVFECPRNIGVNTPASKLMEAFPNELAEGQYGVLYSDSDCSGRIEPLDGYGGAVAYTFSDEQGVCTISYTVDESVVCINLLCE